MPPCNCKGKSAEAQQSQKVQKAAEANRLRIREEQAKQQARENAKK